jgi:hypothetical protein
MSILVIFPNFVLKKIFDDAFGNFFRRIVYEAKNIPCRHPQITKFHEAPCHNPIKNIEISKLMKITTPDFLFLRTSG